MTRRSPLERYRTAWALVAMGVGTWIGHATGVRRAIGQPHAAAAVEVVIEIGLVLTLVPPLAAVRYEALWVPLRQRRLLVAALSQCWVVGPLLAFGLAVLFLDGHPQFMAGLIVFGLARSIATSGSDAADGDGPIAGGLAAINSLLQVPLLAAGAWLFLTVLPPRLGLRAPLMHVGVGSLARAVGLYLALPLIVSGALRGTAARTRGPAWFEQACLPAIRPVSSVALFVTLTALFALDGQAVVGHPREVPLVLMPVACCLGMTFLASQRMGRLSGATPGATTAMAFASAGINAELGLALAVGLFGANHGAPFAAALGLLVDTPAMAALVSLSRLRRNGHRRSPA